MEERFASLAGETARLVAEKNLAYGDSFAKCGDFLRLLWPDGVPPAQYGDMLALVRMFDKMMRIAHDETAFDEEPKRDMLGYALLMLAEAVEKETPR